MREVPECQCTPNRQKIIFGEKVLWVLALGQVAEALKTEIALPGVVDN